MTDLSKRVRWEGSEVELKTPSVRTSSAPDVPFLKEFAIRWFRAFGFRVSRVSLGIWLRRFDREVIGQGLDRTAEWFERKSPKPDADAVHRYASAVMRNIARSTIELDELLGDADGKASA